MRVPTLSVTAMTTSARVMTGRMRLGGVGLETGATTVPWTMPRAGSSGGSCRLGGVPPVCAMQGCIISRGRTSVASKASEYFMRVCAP